jgi:hypothetical protein
VATTWLERFAPATPGRGCGGDDLQKTFFALFPRQKAFARRYGTFGTRVAKRFLVGKSPPAAMRWGAGSGERSSLIPGVAHMNVTGRAGAAASSLTRMDLLLCVLPVALFLSIISLV